MASSPRTGRNSPNRDSSPRNRRLPAASRIGPAGGFFAGGDDPQGDGQIEGGPLLADAGRRQIDGDLAHGKLQPAVAQGGQHPLAALPHLGVRQAHQVKSRQTPADVHLGR